MNNPGYKAAATLQDALEVKQEFGARASILAGATDLILRMRDGILKPRLLIDLGRARLDAISADSGGLRLGACVTLSQILASQEVASWFPALRRACAWFAGPPIRNRATVGGNIANASPAADLVPPLIAYDAAVVLASVSGQRTVPLAEFFTGPGKTIMQPAEVLAEIVLPPMPPGTHATFIKLGQRRSMAISVVNLAVRLTPGETGVIGDARVVLGAVAPTPIRALAAEDILTGVEVSEALIGQAAVQARREARPISDVRGTREYRARMTEVLVRRALLATREEMERAQDDD